MSRQLPEQSESHRITSEFRPATCCNNHRAQWAVCSCGWEYDGGIDGRLITDAVFGHRLTTVEKALGITVEFG